MKKQGIYCIEHVKSGKKYYGSSMNISKRFRDHKSGLRHNHHHCIYLQRAVSKYGLNEFKFYIVEETNFQTKEELYALEQTYIDNNIDGYNIGSAGGGDNLSNHPDKEVIIKKRTETMLKNLAKLTEEERAKRFEHSKGSSNGRWLGGISTKMCPVCQLIKISGGAKTCMSCQTYDRSGSKNSFHGKTHSEETLAILRSKTPWTKVALPEDQSYTKQYEIIYPDGTSKKVYGMKIISTEFKTSIANVALTIERMSRNSLPTKRSRFYQHLIRII